MAETQNKDASTFSQAVGSVTCQSHNCDLCHKQYASKAKLLQHLRKEHRARDQAGPSTSTKGERPKKVMYIDSPRSQSPTRVQENVDDPDDPDPMDPGMNLFDNYENEDFMLEARTVEDSAGSEQFIGGESGDILSLSPHRSDEGVEVPGERSSEVIRVMGDQEFILLQPGQTYRH